jgi:hypothetical protein
VQLIRYGFAIASLSLHHRYGIATQLLRELFRNRCGIAVQSSRNRY